MNWVKFYRNKTHNRWVDGLDVSFRFTELEHLGILVKRAHRVVFDRMRYLIVRRGHIVVLRCADEYLTMPVPRPDTTGYGWRSGGLREKRRQN